jgi:hypothetical protein
VEPRIAFVYEQMTLGLVYIDRVRCPEWLEEIGGYEYNENTHKPVKESDHHMDAMGYRFWNKHARGRRRGDSTSLGPRSAPRSRAVGERGSHRTWEPDALANVPRYKNNENATPQVGGVPRKSYDPF